MFRSALSFTKSMLASVAILASVSLASCGGQSASPMAPAIGPAGGAYMQSQEKVEKETIYALSIGGANGTISVYNAGGRLLRSITLAQIQANDQSFFNISVGGAGLLYAQYPDFKGYGRPPGTLEIFKNQGAKKTASTQLKSRYLLLTSDSKGNAYNICANFVACEYNKAGSRTRRIYYRHSGFGTAVAMATDSKGDLGITDGSGALIFAPKETGPTWEIPANGDINAATSLAFDSTNDIYFACALPGGGVQVFTLGANSPTRIITEGVSTPIQVVVDGADNLYVLNSKGPSVTEYASGQSAPERTITAGLDDPSYITVDAAGNLYVANAASQGSGTGSISIYSPNTTEPTQTITSGLDGPIVVQVSR